MQADNKSEISIDYENLTAQELLYDQVEDFLDEFCGVVTTKESLQFADKWIKESYVPNRSAALDMWLQLAEQFCQVFPTESYDGQKWSKHFALLQRDLWPKYLQAGLNEMYFSDQRMKQTKVKLSDEEFDELPASHLKSLPDYDLFVDFVQADMIIEVSRALKYHFMPYVLRKVQKEHQLEQGEKEQLEFLQEHCITEFLSRDEYVHYVGLIEELDMGGRWSSSETDKYMQQTIGELADQLASAESALITHLEITTN